MPRKQVRSIWILGWAVLIILLLSACAHLLSFLNLNLQRLYPITVFLFVAGGFCLIITGFIRNRYIEGRTINLVGLLLEKSIPGYLRIGFVIVLIYILIIIVFRLTQLGSAPGIPASKALEVRFLSGFTFLIGFLELLILYPPQRRKGAVIVDRE